MKRPATHLVRTVRSTVHRTLGVLCLVGITFAQSAPVPKTDIGGRTLTFDFPEIRIGVAEYDEGPTGTTVFYFPDGVKGAVDVRGGSPGTLNATTLMDAYEYKMIQGVVFSGGSWYGLSAATGVANGIKDLKAAEGEFDFIAGVVGAIVYDVGGRRWSRITPDDRLGKAALLSAKSGWFPLGAHGAGRFTMQGVYYVRNGNADQYSGWVHSGQGGAFRQIGKTKIAVFTVVNAIGTIVDRDGRVVRCKRNDSEAKCPLIADRLRAFAPVARSESGRGLPTGNTTLTLVVTNQKLPFWALKRLAKQVHGSMNRAIYPFATEDDGDVLYAVTTDEVENDELSAVDLGVIASEMAWDAVLSSVPALPALPSPSDYLPSPAVLAEYAGEYEFYGANYLNVKAAGDHLAVTMKGNGRIYFASDTPYSLIPAGKDLFLVDGPAKDVIRFDSEDGKVTGLTLNPGPWANKAKKTR